MIKFIVLIEEQKSGFVGVRCETPAGVASPREIELGLKFKEVVRTLAERSGAKVTDWASPGNEIGPQN